MLLKKCGLTAYSPLSHSLNLENASNIFLVKQSYLLIHTVLCQKVKLMYAIMYASYVFKGFANMLLYFVEIY